MVGCVGYFAGLFLQGSSEGSNKKKRARVESLEDDGITALIMMDKQKDNHDDDDSGDNDTDDVDAVLDR